jgi:alpha-beta hydrolase superfamily lysophospholipase
MPADAKGFMATPYVARLSSELKDTKWSLCQLHMRSSYMGFGTGSLNRDFEDLCAALTYLKASGKQRVVLMGHSTGSQNSIHYVLTRASAESAPAINGVIVNVSLLDPAHDLSFKPQSAIANLYDSSLAILAGRSNCLSPRK